MSREVDPKMTTIETFTKPDYFWLARMEQDKPSCFNGFVQVKRYRVTVEEIAEPVEVIRERIQKLWDECDNHHHWRPLEAAAKEAGFELSHDTRRSSLNRSRE